LLLVNIAKSAYGCDLFTQSKGFAVNILARDQRELSNRFASAGTDKFSGVGWQKASTEMYQGAQASGQQPGQQADPEQGPEDGKKDDGEVTDVDFEEVK